MSGQAPATKTPGDRAALSSQFPHPHRSPSQKAQSILPLKKSPKPITARALRGSPRPPDSPPANAHSGRDPANSGPIRARPTSISAASARRVWIGIGGAARPRSGGGGAASEGRQQHGREGEGGGADSDEESQRRSHGEEQRIDGGCTTKQPARCTQVQCADEGLEKHEP